MCLVFIQMQSTHTGVPPQSWGHESTLHTTLQVPSPFPTIKLCWVFALLLSVCHQAIPRPGRGHSPGAGCHVLPSSSGGHTVHPGWDVLACVNATNPCRAQSLVLLVDAQHLNANCTWQRGRERVTDRSYKEKQLAIRTTQMKLLEFLIADKAFPWTA